MIHIYNGLFIHFIHKLEDIPFSKERIHLNKMFNNEELNLIRIDDIGIESVQCEHRSFVNLIYCVYLYSVYLCSRG